MRSKTGGGNGLGTRLPSTCSRSPASSFQGLRKAGLGPGNEATHHLIQCGQRTARHETTTYLTGRTFLRRLDEVRQLLHEIGHLLDEAGQIGQQIVADSHHGVWQAGAQE